MVELKENETSFVKADSFGIHQIILNLCTNAHHAMEEKGGVLEVSFAAVALDVDRVAIL